MARAFQLPRRVHPDHETPPPTLEDLHVGIAAPDAERLGHPLPAVDVV